MSNLVKSEAGGIQPDPLDRIERGMALLKALDCLDDRAKMILSSAVLNQVAGPRANDSGERMLSLADGFLELTDASPKESTVLAHKHGKTVKAAYIQQVGKEPPTHKQLVNGRECNVCDYTFSFLEHVQDDLQELVTAGRN